MKHLDIRMILLLAFPLVFAVLFVLYLQIFSPDIPPELSMPFSLLFAPVVLIVFPSLMGWHFGGIILGIILITLLCIAVEYFYRRVLLQGQRGQLIPLVVATYLLTCLVMGMVLLLPLAVQEEDMDLVQLYLREVPKNETQGYVVHFTPQDLEEFPVLASLIESGRGDLNADKWQTLQQRYSLGSFVEYNGTYYSFNYIIIPVQ